MCIFTFCELNIRNQRNGHVLTDASVVSDSVDNDSIKQMKKLYNALKNPFLTLLVRTAMLHERLDKLSVETKAEATQTH